VGKCRARERGERASKGESEREKEVRERGERERE